MGRKGIFEENLLFQKGIDEQKVRGGGDRLVDPLWLRACILAKWKSFPSTPLPSLTLKWKIQ